MGYPRKAVLFLFALTLISIPAGYFIFTSHKSFRFNILHIVIWCVAGVVSESIAVYLRKGNIYASTTEAVFIVSFLISGPAVTLLVIITASLFWVSKNEDGYNHIFKTAFRYTLFNLTHFIVILGSITALYKFLGGLNNQHIYLIPAIITAPLFFIFSCIVNAFFYKFEENIPAGTYLFSTFREYLPGAFMVSLSGIMIALAFEKFRLLSLLLFVIPVLLTRLTFSILSEQEE